MRRLPRNPARFLYPPCSPTGWSEEPDSIHARCDTKTNRVELYLHRARLIDTIRLHLRTNPARSLAHLLPSIDSFVAAHALRSAPSPDAALAFFNTLRGFAQQQPPSHPRCSLLSHNALHAMAKILSVSDRPADLHSLISSISLAHFPAVLPPSPMDLLRWYASAGDLDYAAEVFDNMRVQANRKNQRHMCAESYNLMMVLYAKYGRNSAAVSLFDRMIADGAYPNARTYTVIIEHLVRHGKLHAAMEIFRKLPLMRVRRTSRQYTVLADGFLATGKFDYVKILLSEMRSEGIVIGQNLRSIILRLRDNGSVHETEEFVREFEPDRRIEGLPFFISNDEEEDEEEDGDGEDDESNNAENGIVPRTRLKPWLDPSALANALTEWDSGEVSTLEEANIVWTSRLVCKLLRAFKKADTAWEFFCWVALQPGGFTHDVYTVSRMLVILARHGRAQLAFRLLAKIKHEEIRLSPHTLRLVIDSFGISKEGEAAVKVFREVRSLCGNVPKADLLLLYSSLLRTLVKCRKSSEAMDYLDEMIISGIMPDIQIFYGLMQYFALDGDLRRVQQLFGMVRQSGMEADVYLYQMIIRAYCDRKIAALGLRMFEDMWTRGMKPDIPTKEHLVRSLWKEGKFREAACVEERCEDAEGCLPHAVPGHVWTVSSEDLKRVCEIYEGSIIDHGE